MTNSMCGDTMTVAELIDCLQGFPPDMPVLTEGCDCSGAVRSLLIQEEDGDFPAYIYLQRSGAVSASEENEV